LGAQSLGANLGLRTSFCRTRAQGLGELACGNHGDVKSSPIAASVPEGLARKNRGVRIPDSVNHQGAEPDLPGFSGAGEGVHACSADSIATKILGFQE
jgi:hypothetical protein